MKRTNQTNHKARYRSNSYYKRWYGKDVTVTRLGQVTIVHLDQPNKEEIKKRIEEIMREEIAGEAFFDDCPLCRKLQKQPYDIVYYEQGGL